MDLVAIYKRDIDQYPSLGKEMELELALQARAGCLVARKTLVKANLRWVVSVAARYADRAELLDLIQAGNLGLLRAVDRFDPTRGAKFSTYAFWPVHQAIRDELWREMYPLRLPRRSHYRLWHQARMRQMLTQTLGREPEARELAAAFNSPPSENSVCPDEQESLALDYLPVYHCVSLEAPVSPDDSETLADVIEDQDSLTPFDHASKKLLRTALERVLSGLADRERQILEMRYGWQDGVVWELPAIARYFNLTVPRVRYLLGNAIAQLQNEETFNLLAGY